MHNIRTDVVEQAEALREGIRSALQTLYDALNHGQQKQIIKDEAVKKLFDTYGVSCSE